ncbi:hypothetical protein [Streptomyces griseoaurantiacus]|uniref:Uncharacterized protein n=1 Tax=Streptomyces griseoaurantiacus TaxID=68213 RepID=A0A7W2DNH5_9ACTN|nr:hypothetical protein [Streptomyces griseoaurantiacus]
MATLLYRLGTTAYRRWPVLLTGWLIALVDRRVLRGRPHVGHDGPVDGLRPGGGGRLRRLRRADVPHPRTSVSPDDKAWWLPKRLDRVLPDVDIEGDNLHRPHPANPHTDADDRQLTKAGER